MTRPDPYADNYDDRRAYYLQHLTNADRQLDDAEHSRRAAERQVEHALENARMAQQAWEQFLAREGDAEGDADVIAAEAAQAAGERIRAHGLTPEAILANLVANAPSDPEVAGLIYWQGLVPVANAGAVLRLLTEAADELDHDDDVAARQVRHDQWADTAHG